MTVLNLALVQQASALDPAENRGRMREQMGRLEENPRLVVFPEVFMRDFGKPGSGIAEFAEDLDGPFVQSMIDLAKEHETTIVAGMFEASTDPDRPYNTLVVVSPDGLQTSYRKIHLYDSFGYKESERLLAGEVAPVTVDVDGWRLGLMTCYDLRFPELARALVERGSQMLVVPAAWVAGPGKVEHWRTLLRARAIENTVYVAAAAQPAPRYTGHSMLVTPTGEVPVECDENPGTVGSRADHSVLDEARERNPSLANRRF